MQKTILRPVTVEGIGLHSGRDVRLTINPAQAHHGIVFRRVDISGQDNLIPANHHHIIDTKLCTVIGLNETVRVATIEHLMAALRACGIDNALIDINGPECPVLDGSAQPFIQAIEEAGLFNQNVPRRIIKILKPISYSEGDKTASLTPAAVPQYEATLHYKGTLIGTQSYALKLVNGNFKHDVADCRTFCLRKDIEAMRANGLALGGSLDNAVVVDDQNVMNEEGLRCHDEFVRHKILDAVGDLALAGGLIWGAYKATRPGHDMNAKLLKTLFQSPDCWVYEDLYINIETADEAAFLANTPPSPKAVSGAVAA